jgi:hypothetical protein
MESTFKEGVEQEHERCLLAERALTESRAVFKEYRMKQRVYRTSSSSQPTEGMHPV